MVVVIVKVKLQTKPTFVFFFPMGTGSVDGPSVLMEGVRGEHEHHDQQRNDKEEDKGWFAILLLQLLQPYAATCAISSFVFAACSHPHWRICRRHLDF